MISIAGWWRRLKLRVTGKELILTGHCRQCGSCCRRLQLQHGKQWLRSRRKFNALIKNDPEFARFEVIGRDRQGLLVFNCNMLGADNRCQDYDNRPRLCRDFPDKEIFFCGATLPDGCGFTLSSGTAFAKILRRQQQKNKQQRPNRNGL